MPHLQTCSKTGYFWLCLPVIHPSLCCSATLWGMGPEGTTQGKAVVPRHTAESCWFLPQARSLAAHCRDRAGFRVARLSSICLGKSPPGAQGGLDGSALCVCHLQAMPGLFHCMYCFEGDMSIWDVFSSSSHPLLSLLSCPPSVLGFLSCQTPGLERHLPLLLGVQIWSRN